MNTLEKYLKKLEDKSIKYNDLKLITLGDAEKILQELEVEVRTECECEEAAKLKTYY